MLLEELVLHNFGIYKGRHKIWLSPSKDNQPIVLLGALNGGGKTTFLDALQLALYGKFANCSNRGALSYPDFLKHTINHSVDPSEGAALELQFKHRREGVDETIRVMRRWKSTGKMLKEVVEVLRNGQLDPFITDRWYEFVEEFIPNKISSLFFFDGEKIESLASPEKSSELIRTGLHALLGLDLVDRLSDDLRAVENKRKMEIKTENEQEKLKELQSHIQALQDRQAQSIQKRAEAKNVLQQIDNYLQKLRNEFRLEGGELLEQRDAIEAELRATEQRLKDTEDKLRDLAAGDAPLMLVRNLLRKCETQTRKEAEAETFIQLKDTLCQRDRKIIDALRSKKCDSGVLKVLSELFSCDISQREESASTERYLHITRTAFSRLNHSYIDELTISINNQIELAMSVSELLTALQRKLSGVPDPESVKGITDKIEQKNKERDQARLKIEVITHELEEIKKSITGREQEYLRHLERTTDQKFIDDTSRRILKHSGKLRTTFAEFRRRVAAKHIAQLEALILESFQQLIRKSDLVNGIRIAPETYQLTLYKRSKEVLPPERLSAGERQLLAVSILWGLAKASGRPLPAVIDTPLGRLDGVHRGHLVNNYFPFASHQVLLLSTDEEIDEKHYSDLKPSIGREYLIQYDEPESTSKFTTGYFC